MTYPVGLTRDEKPRCEAIVGWGAGDFALVEIRCHQHVGLRFLEAPDGTRHAYCAKHEAWVRSQVRRLAPRTA